MKKLYIYFPSNPWGAQKHGLGPRSRFVSRNLLLEFGAAFPTHRLSCWSLVQHSHYRNSLVGVWSSVPTTGISCWSLKSIPTTGTLLLEFGAAFPLPESLAGVWCCVPTNEISCWSLVQLSHSHSCSIPTTGTLLLELGQLLGFDLLSRLQRPDCYKLSS